MWLRALQPLLPLTLASFVAASASPTRAEASRPLSFGDRLLCQEAIERVYYTHQIGTAKRFEEAVPWPVLERKVRIYLKQSVALDELWQTPVTSEMLQAEIVRIARDTRYPDRLLEIYRALDQDPFLVQECFARPVLVDRLIRSFFAHDRGVRAGARDETSRTREERVQWGPDVDRDSRGRWDEWWASVELQLDDTRVQPVAQPRTLPEPRFPPEGPAPWNDEVRTGSAMEPVSSCAPDDIWQSSSLAANFDFQRSDHTAVWTGSMMIVWGGRATGAFRELNTGFRYDPLTDTWIPLSEVNAPAARYRHTAVWTGDRMIVWGGQGAGDLDTGGEYEPATDTWTPVATVNAPSPRWGHSAVWSGTRMIIWGGASNGTVDTGGQYDPETDTWLPTSTIGAPLERFRHSAVWTGTQMVVWGGIEVELVPPGSQFIYHLTGGRYDPALDTWQPTSTLGAPAERADHTALWTGSRMVVWGGQAAGVAFSTGGRYNPVNDNWSTTSADDVPEPRSQHTALWTGSEMIVWGGLFGKAGTYNDGGRYNPTNDQWTPLSTVDAPAERFAHTAIWTGDLMVIWGSDTSGGRYAPATDSWTPVSSGTAPSARSEHTAVWTGNQMLIWGGLGSGSGDSGGRYDPLADSWSAISSLNAPIRRHDHVAVWTGDEMIVWGGDGNQSITSEALNTGGRYDAIADIWAPTQLVNAPTSRFSHTAVWTGDEMIVWGGRSETMTTVRTGGRYDPAADAWTSTSVALIDSRREHTAVWTGDEMIIWGGENTNAQPLGIGARYDPVVNSWNPTASLGAPEARTDHSAIWTGDEMIVWGGRSLEESFDTGGRYDPATDSWMPTSVVNAPLARVSHTAIWADQAMLVWGGVLSSSFPPCTDTGARYDPASDSWAPTSLTGAPTAREEHTAVWTGARMIVWGGVGDEFPHLRSSGGSYSIALTVDVDEDTVDCSQDCDDSDATTFPGAAQLCDGLNNDCDDPTWPVVATNEIDGDGDGQAECAGDCDDGEAVTFAGAPEVNDGLDNQCPGDFGFGVVDEISGVSGLLDPGDASEFSWPAQAGATRYEAVRSTAPDFPAGCSRRTTTGTSWIDTGAPGAGGAFYYLVRALKPVAGSWGVDSSGTERTGICP